MIRDYNTAIQFLNSLQSNVAVLDSLRKSGVNKNLFSIPEMKSYIRRLGYSVQSLNQLNAIHVAGTKGKGSTSAFCESILLQYSHQNGNALKTGLFTSPHLLEVRERIRINGKPISKELFAQYFFQVWDKLEANKLNADEKDFADKPGYFRYLTLVSFHAFLQEKVDVAVIEVGIGGEYDSTNVLEQPVVCGITSLGIDHVTVLGDTIDKIAWHKAGIIKQNVPIFSSPQPAEAMQVISERAGERGASRCTIVSQKELDEMQSINLGLKGKHQHLNSALARALCKEWVKIQNSKGMAINSDENKTIKGLEKTFWPGRCQVVQWVKYPSVTWYLDGAHTPESLEVCAEWFLSVCKEDLQKSNAVIFNCTHGRQGAKMFPPFLKVFGKDIRFKKIIFTTNDPWTDPLKRQGGDLIDVNSLPDPNLTLQKELQAVFQQEAKIAGLVYDEIQLASSVERACELASDAERVLITGSLYLVGSSMTVMELSVA